ncbi:MAG: type IVB secretion system coupling complex protein DotM/IcmP [Candidatus Comchoanobacterales bacterium]
MRGGQQQQNPANPALDLFLLLGFILGVAILCWYFFSANISSVVFSIREAEITFLKWIIRAYDAFINLLPQAFSSALSADVDAVLGKLNDCNQFMQNVDLTKVNSQQFFSVLREFGEVLMIPVIILSVILGCLLLFFSRSNRYKRTYSMSTLSEAESENWSEIIPVLNKDIAQLDLDKAPWGMSVQPLTFAKKYGLVESDRQHNKSVAKLNQEKAYRVFAAQMGPRWNGLEGLPGYILALFAIFAAKSQHDSTGYRTLLKQIAASAKTGQLNFGGTRELLIKHVRAPDIGRAVGPHAYLYGVMASMLSLARQDGVLAVAEFIWLKPLDRPLWYMLSSVGRQTVFPEVAGPYSHWLVERRLRRPLVVPMIQCAIDALSSAMAEFIYNPDEQ